MKVIGFGDAKYICEVSHSEIEQFLNLYYGKMDKLKIGREIDLGKGYDWYKDSKECLRSTEEFIKANKKIIETMMKWVEFIGNKK